MTLVVFKTVRCRVPRRLLQALASTIVAQELRSSTPNSVHLVFAGDSRIRSLNRQFRNIDRPTDVLSFNMDDPDEPESVLGEIYISIPTAQRQARQAEIMRLVCHGLLHLCGYDHQTKAEEARMMARQDYYLGSAELTRMADQ
ncbi:MAG: rRNA maturation RNase YbeY [Candidatus Zixiibacteriota bacterium]